MSVVAGITYTCKGCSAALPESAFSWHPRGYRYHKCRKCRAAQQSNWQKRNASPTYSSSLPSIDQIQRAVAWSHQISVEAIREHDCLGARRRRLAWPRQEAIELTALLTGHSYPFIGKRFGGRDHTTVIHARRAVNARRRIDPELDNRLKRLTLELLQERR